MQLFLRISLVFIDPDLNSLYYIGINLMLNAAGILFALIFWKPGDFLQENREQFVAIVNIFGLCLAFFGEFEHVSHAEFNKAVFFEQAHCPADTGAGNSQFICHIYGANKSVF